jgi:GNAT superfamily N-acetyltransferase
VAALSIQPAATLDINTLTDAFNAGYSGYILPVNITADQLQHHIEANDIDLPASKTILNSREPVGICFLGIRGKRGWIGGLGVHPDYRRKGLGRQLMQAVMQETASRGLATIDLEVIVGNDGARQLYLDLGFADTRRLLVLERQPAPIQAHKVIIENATTADILRLQAAFHPVPVAWQQTLKPDSTATAWLVRDGSTALAYAVGHVSDTALQWLDMGCFICAPSSASSAVS